MTITTLDLQTPVDLAGVFSLSLIKSQTDLPGEYWKTHPSGLQVSNLGRVQGTSGRIIGSTKVRKSKAAHGVRLDYVRVCTSAYGTRVNSYVHVLVLETFVGPRPEGHDGDHINSDIFDNRLTNLRWRSAYDNRAHTKN